VSADSSKKPPAAVVGRLPPVPNFSTPKAPPLSNNQPSRHPPRDNVAVSVPIEDRS
jgi:hypothetical protein